MFSHCGRNIICSKRFLLKNSEKTQHNGESCTEQEKSNQCDNWYLHGTSAVPIFLHKIILFEFFLVSSTTTLLILVYSVLSFHSDIISFSISRLFESSLCFSLDLMITGNDCRDRHKQLRAPVNLAMTEAGV